MQTTNHVRLLTKRDGFYSIYVFENLDSSSERYISATKCPNWNIPSIEINDTGFVTTKYAEVGDKYIDKDGIEKQYKYTAIYLIDFVKDKIADNTKEYTF